MARPSWAAEAPELRSSPPMNANPNAILNGGATIAPLSDGSYVMNELNALKVPPRPEHLHRLAGTRRLTTAARLCISHLSAGHGVGASGVG